MVDVPVRDGPSCPGCGLPNYSGLCPVCRGDEAAYEAELVPPFPSLQEDCENRRMDDLWDILAGEDGDDEDDD